MSPLTDDCPVWAESGAGVEVKAAIPIEIAAVSFAPNEGQIHESQRKSCPV